MKDIFAHLDILDLKVRLNLPKSKHNKINYWEVGKRIY